MINGNDQTFVMSDGVFLALLDKRIVHGVVILQFFFSKTIKRLSSNSIHINNLKKKIIKLKKQTNKWRVTCARQMGSLRNRDFDCDDDDDSVGCARRQDRARA